MTLTLKTRSGLWRLCPALLHKREEPGAGLGATAGDNSKIWTTPFHNFHHYVQDVVFPCETGIIYLLYDLMSVIIY